METRSRLLNWPRTICSCDIHKSRLRDGTSPCPLLCTVLPSEHGTCLSLPDPDTRSFCQVLVSTCRGYHYHLHHYKHRQGRQPQHHNHHHFSSFLPLASSSSYCSSCSWGSSCSLSNPPCCCSTCSLPTYRNPACFRPLATESSKVLKVGETCKPSSSP